MKPTPRTRAALAWPATPLALAAVTLACRLSGANSTTVGFAFLITVLILASWGGWVVGAAASVAAMLCFNFFFLPPLGTLTIAEPSNWVALLAFLSASTLASRLVATARRQAAQARERRREVEILYELCFSLFTVRQEAGAHAEATAITLRAIGAEAGRLYLAGSAGPALEGGGPIAEVEPASQERALGRHELVLEPLAGGGRRALIPLLVGTSASGVLVAEGVLAGPAVLAPAGRLLALALERERLLAEGAFLAAVAESEHLKTALLRAVSHDLRTPLTAMRLEIENLERHLSDRADLRDSVAGLALEQGRLARRIDNLLALARLEAGLARPRPEPVPAGELFRGARESLSALLAARTLEVSVELHCPELLVDPTLILEALVNLLENAARAAPEREPLGLAAERDPDSASRIRLEVRDRGPGVPAGIRRLFGGSGLDFGPGSGNGGDRASGGLGLRIAQSFATACGGSLALLERSGGGTVARLSLPAAAEPLELTA